MMRHHADDGPCRPMRGLLDEAADGRAKGVRAWYARAHAARCPGCGRYLGSLSEIVERLAAAQDGAVDEETLERLRGQL